MLLSLLLMPSFVTANSRITQLVVCEFLEPKATDKGSVTFKPSFLFTGRRRPYKFSSVKFNFICLDFSTGSIKLFVSFVCNVRIILMVWDNVLASRPKFRGNQVEVDVFFLEHKSPKHTFFGMYLWIPSLKFQTRQRIWGLINRKMSPRAKLSSVIYVRVIP